MERPPPPLETSPEERAERVNLLRPIIDWFWGAFSAVLGSDCSPRANGLFAPGLPTLAGSRLKVETQPAWLTPLAEFPHTERIAVSRLKVETQPAWLTPLAESPHTKRIAASRLKVETQLVWLTPLAEPPVPKELVTPLGETPYTQRILVVRFLALTPLGSCMKTIKNLDS